MNRMIKNTIKGLSWFFHLFPLKKNKVFLMNFDGTAVGHDSKAFVRWCLNQGHFFEFVWGAKDKNYASKMKYQGVRFVPIKSLRGLYDLLTAKTIIYNINPPSYVAFRKGQVLINTWHGFPYKVAGKYRDGYDYKQFNTTTCFLSDAAFCTERTIRGDFDYQGEVLTCGTPRTDIFYSPDLIAVSKETRIELGIEDEYKIVLYAPTFRQNKGEYSYQDSGLDISTLKESLSRRFGGQWIVLCRLHPMIAHQFNIDRKDVIDVSLYDDTQNLLCVSDVLITDYSSVNWDFALMKRPVFIYAEDVEEYKESRGLVVPLDSWPFPISKNNVELQHAIESFDEIAYLKRVEKYQEMLGNYDIGKSCETVYKYIIAKGGMDK